MVASIPARTWRIDTDCRVPAYATRSPWRRKWVFALLRMEKRKRVPPGGTETRHVHQQAQQFFFVLSGEAVHGDRVEIEQEDCR